MNVTLFPNTAYLIIIKLITACNTVYSDAASANATVTMGSSSTIASGGPIGIGGDISNIKGLQGTYFSLSAFSVTVGIIASLIQYVHPNLPAVVPGIGHIVRNITLNIVSTGEAQAIALWSSPTPVLTTSGTGAVVQAGQVWYASTFAESPATNQSPGLTGPISNINYFSPTQPIGP